MIITSIHSITTKSQQDMLDAAYERVDTSINKLSIKFGTLFDKLYYSNQRYIYRKLFLTNAQEVLARYNNIVQVYQIMIGPENNFISLLKIGKTKNTKDFFQPVTSIDLDEDKINYKLKHYKSNRDYLSYLVFIDEVIKPDELISNPNLYLYNLYYSHNKAPSPIITKSTKLKSVESIELSQTRLFANNVNLMSIKVNANFITETLNDSIGTGYDYFITLEDTILSLTKNTENIAKYDGLIKDNHRSSLIQTPNGLSFFTTHEVGKTGLRISVLSPVRNYILTDSYINYYILLSILILSLLIGIISFITFINKYRKVDKKIHATLKLQQATSQKNDLLHKINEVQRNMTMLTPFLPENFSSYVKNNSSRKISRQEVCIMFIQIPSLSKPSSIDDNSDTYIEKINKIYTILATNIQKHQGIIDKFIGDIILAIWVDDADSILVKNACLAALDINKSLSHEDIKIGINLGTCDVGSYGSHTRAEYTLSGSPVNLTSRICKINNIYGTKILISEYANDCLDNQLPSRFIDAVIAPKTYRGFKIFEILEKSDKSSKLLQSSFQTEFHHAFLLYQNKQWPQALQAFSDMLKSYPEDQLIKTFINRIKKSKLPKNWLGFWQL